MEVGGELIFLKWINEKFLLFIKVNLLKKLLIKKEKPPITCSNPSRAIMLFFFLALFDYPPSIRFQSRKCKFRNCVKKHMWPRADWKCAHREADIPDKWDVCSIPPLTPLLAKLETHADMRMWFIYGLPSKTISVRRTVCFRRQVVGGVYVAHLLILLGIWIIGEKNSPDIVGARAREQRRNVYVHTLYTLHSTLPSHRSQSV